MTDYRALLEDVPELALKLAGAITPSSKPSDGTSRSTTNPWTSQDVALDDLETVMRELVDSVDFWWSAQNEYLVLAEPVLPDGVIRVGGNIRYRAVVSDDPEQAARDANQLVRILLTWWDEIEGHPQWEWWVESLDEWLTPRILRLRRAEKRAHPRRCQNCLTLSVWADLEHASALCDACGDVMRAEVWLSVKEAAARLSVDPRTVRRWVAEDLVPHRKSGRTNQVEWTACNEHHQEATARRLLNLA